MDNFVCNEIWPKSILKDMVVYVLTFHCTCCRYDDVSCSKIKGLM